MATLEDTGRHYLLTIPTIQRERTRAISGRKWSSDRNCWVFTRTRDVYAQLIEEFADELVGMVPEPPAVDADFGDGEADSQTPATKRPQSRSLSSYDVEVALGDLDELTDRVNELEEELHITLRARDHWNGLSDAWMEKARQSRDKAAELETKLAKCERERDQFSARCDAFLAQASQLRESSSMSAVAIEQLTSERNQLRDRVRALEERETQLQISVSTIAVELGRVHTERERLLEQLAAVSELGNQATRGCESDIFELAGHLASSAANDETLCESARQLRNSSIAIVDLGRRVETELRKRLNDRAANFYELIVAAKNRNLISSAAAGFSQTLRTMRNVESHEHSVEQNPARSLIALFACALVLREIRRVDQKASS